MDDTTHTRAKRKLPKMAISSTTTLKIIGLVVLVAISFYAGGLYQKHQDMHRQVGAQGTAGQSAFGGGRFRGGRFGRQMSTSQVTAVSSSSITTKASDGSTKTYTIDSGTQIIKNGSAASASDIAVGDTVAVIPSRTDTSIAGRIIDNPASASNAPSVDPGSVQSN